MDIPIIILYHTFKKGLNIYENMFVNQRYLSSISQIQSKFLSLNNSLQKYVLLSPGSVLRSNTTKNLISLLNVNNN